MSDFGAVDHRAPSAAPGPASAFPHKTRVNLSSDRQIPEPLRDGGRAARLSVQQHGAAPRWAGASRLLPLGTERCHPPRAERTVGARRQASQRASERGGLAGVETQAPSGPHVPPALPRRGLRRTRSGSDPGRSPTPRQVSGAEAGEYGGHGAGATPFLGLSQRVGSLGCGVERGGDQGWVRRILQAALPGAPLLLPRRPKQLFTTKSERSSRRRGAESFLSPRDPFWRILLCSTWARVQL